MTEYTPEKVAELVEEARKRAGAKWKGMEGSTNHLVNSMADALTAVSADRDRLHKAITEALGELGDPESTGPWLSGNIPNAVRRILRAALDQEGDDDE